MTCLSLWQPWSQLLVTGAKGVETRSWPIRHRGPLLIHAAKTWNPNLACVAADGPFRAALERSGIVFTDTIEACKAGWGMPFGAVVGCVDVVACVPVDVVRSPGQDTSDLPAYYQVPETEIAFGDYTPGRFAFVCENPVRFATPVPARGRQGLFDVPDELVATALTEARRS